VYSHILFRFGQYPILLEFGERGANGLRSDRVKAACQECDANARRKGCPAFFVRTPPGSAASARLHFILLINIKTRTCFGQTSNPEGQGLSPPDVTSVSRHTIQFHTA